MTCARGAWSTHSSDSSQAGPAHVPHFLELSLTLAQMKALYLVAAAGPMRMSEVAERLGTAASTASGVVDGLVQRGLIDRGRTRPIGARSSSRDRGRARAAGALHELGRGHLRQMLASVERDKDLRTIEAAITILTAAARRQRTPSDMTWLTRAAVGRRSVTILIAVGLFVWGVVAWGSLKQELLPDVWFPVATVIAPFPGAGADDVADQVVAPIERAVLSVAGIDQVNSTSANSIGFVTAQFEYGTDVDEATTRWRRPSWR